mgnify:CR=1 FL=1
MKRRIEPADLADDIDHVMDAIAWRIPITEMRVRQAETAIAALPPVNLPVSLADPAALFDRFAHPPLNPTVPITPITPQTDIDQHLARAARQGRPIPPEIEARMRQDRLAARRALERDDHGQDDR